MDGNQDNHTPDPIPVESTPGTHRSRRALPALDPARTLVDERAGVDLLVFATRFAELLTYFDADGQPASDWSKFFSYDASFLLAEICAVDQTGEDATTQALERSLSGESSGTLRNLDHKMLERETLYTLYGWAKRLDTWYRRASGAKTGGGDTLRLALESILRKDLRPHYRMLLRDRQWLAWLDEWMADDNYEFASLWRDDSPPSCAADRSASRSDRLIAALQAFNQVNRSLVATTREELQKSLEQPNHPPHAALYLAFLGLLEITRDDLNRFTSRHLDHYYRSVLKLRERGGTPDSVLLTFDLAKSVAEFELLAGTRLRAGKDAAGHELLYAIDRDVFLNKAKIAALKTLYVATTPNPGSELHPRRVLRILACPRADSEDGLGRPLKQPDQGWPAFGLDFAGFRSQEYANLNGRMGLLVAAPILLLLGGERDITLSLRFTDGAGLDTALREYLAVGVRTGHLDPEECMEEGIPHPGLHKLLSDAFLLHLSGAAGWLRVEHPRFLRRPEAAEWVDVSFRLEADAPAVIECGRELHGMNVDPPRPCLRFELNPDARVFAYTFFRDLVLAEVAIRVRVRGLGGLELRGGLGPIQGDQPFPPFGAVPIQGSFLEMGHWEIRQKLLENLGFTLDWLNLPKPPDSLRTWYQGYPQGMDNGSFQARLLMRAGTVWKEVRRDPAQGPSVFPLFEQFDPADERLLPHTVQRFVFEPALRLGQGERGEAVGANPPGVLRLELAEPAIGFGHEVYPKVLAQAALANSRTPAEDGKPPPVNLPNPPFVPQAKALTLEYTAAERLLLDRQAPPGEAARIHLAYLMPFGYSDTGQGTRTLFPSYEAEGHLHIGLAGLEPGQTLTLLFQVRDRNAAVLEGTDDNASHVRWSYLARNLWHRFEPASIVRDTSAGLLRSGIITLRIPPDIDAANTSMTPGLYWLQASVRRRPYAWPNIVAIYPQAATATRVNSQGEAALGGVLPAGMVKEFAAKTPAIATIRQPLPSQSGRAGETAAQFHTRVSERLRHKQRAVQPADYERIVLDAFPEIGQAKCLTPNNSQGYRVPALAPGEVMLVVVPVRDAAGSFLEPKVPRYLLQSIEEALAGYASPSVHRIRVRSPAYERIKLYATLRLRPGYESGPTVRRLNEDVARFLAPWRYEAETPLGIGGGMGQAHRLWMHIESLPYVDELAGLSLLHTYRKGEVYRARYWPPEGAAADVRQDAPIVVSTPWSVLVPADGQDILVLDSGRRDRRTQPRVGLGVLELGVDWVVG